MSKYRIADPDITARAFKALANPNRLALLERIAACCAPGTVWNLDPETATCVGQLSQGLDIAPSTVSHHIKELVDARIIRTQRQGKKVACWIDPETIDELSHYFHSLSAKRTLGDTLTEQKDDVRQATLDTYRRAAQTGDACGAGCCGRPGPPLQDLSTLMGYSPDDQTAVPQGANLGLGCGNPQAIAELSPGETVLDLGAGGGFDCFLAAGRVGPGGRVIGVDMTPEMVARARENAAQGDYAHVEFRLGEIEHLPVADQSVDVIMSNCVINLSPDKRAVFEEAYRVLKPGGRLAISDMVATRPLPDDLQKDLALWAGCVAGAMPVDDLKVMLADIGFTEVRITPEEASREFVREWFPERNVEQYVVSARIQARTPQ